jgi:hypothetical protein
MDIMRGHILAASDDRATDVMDNHVLVLATDGVTAEVTSGGLTHTRKVKVEELEEPVASPPPLMRRLAYSIAGAPKRFEDKDQAIMEAVEARQDAESKLRDIRKWMISLHKSGELHRSDLDTFLSEFGLEPYPKRWKGAMTVIVTVEVDGAKDEDEAIDAAMEWVEAKLKGHHLPDGVKFHGDDGTDYLGYDFEPIREDLT